VRRLLLSPRWLAGHVLVAACFVGFLLLGWWQWERAHAADGGGQNLGYALQWPLFAAFVVFGWWRMLRLEAAKSAGTPTVEEPAPVDETVRRGPAVPRYVPPVIEDETDEELAAYNRHLASLHKQDRPKQ
jgi:DNA-binding transcriptional regulator of glucitol operon